MDVPNRINCPIQRATDVVSDQWSFLILREFILEGPRKYSDLQNVLNVSPNTLSTRLKRLETNGVLERRIYQNNPPRARYHLTEKGQALAPVVGALRAWGEKWGGDAAT